MRKNQGEGGRKIQGCWGKKPKTDIVPEGENMKRKNKKNKAEEEMKLQRKEREEFRERQEIP